MSTVIYHNPRCSKSRETLALLRDNGVEPTVIEYLKVPPTKHKLKQLLSMLDMQPRDLMRRKESLYKTLGLDEPSLTKDQLIDAMVANPKLIERPIVVSGDKAAVGRPPERVLDIL